MPLGDAEKHGIIRLFKGESIAAVVFGGNLAVLHHIAVRGKHTALALAHLFADFTEVQIFVDFIRHLFQCRYKIIICVKFAERLIVVGFIGNLAMRRAVGHVDEPFHRNGSVLGLDGIHHHHALEAVCIPIAQG